MHNHNRRHPITTSLTKKHAAVIRTKIHANPENNVLRSTFAYHVNNARNILVTNQECIKVTQVDTLQYFTLIQHTAMYEATRHKHARAPCEFP